MNTLSRSSDGFMLSWYSEFIHLYLPLACIRYADHTDQCECVSSVHHCIWVFARALYEYVKLSCVAESAAPLHVACGVGTAGVGEPAVGAAGTHSLQLCAGGLSCSCEGVCEQWRL